jgi:plasmid stabilization system protein ParE
MTRRLVLEPEAEAEIAEAASWYEARSAGLGPEFLRAVEDLLVAIQRNPHQYQVAFREVRRAAVRRFPYVLIYTATEQEIIVVACIHGRRSPTRWKGRIS